MSLPRESVIKIDLRMSEEPPKPEISVLFINLTHCKPLTQFLSCTAIVFVCYLAYGYFLELIFSKPEVKPISLFITLIQFGTTMCLSYCEVLTRDSIKRKVPLKTYVLLAALTLGTMALSNLALSYLNYPTQLIFKSCKLIPVMIGSIIILNKRYGFLDYVAAVFMCIGLTMFTLADSNTSPNFDIIGVLIISGALLCDAIIGNVQEKAMKQYQASIHEVIFYSYAIAFVYLFVITTAAGVLYDGLTYIFQDYIPIYKNIFLLSLSGFCGLQAVLSLVRISGAAVAVTVTTMRKALSIIISFLLFSKPFVFQYVWSGLLVVLAIYLNHYSKQNPGYVPSLALGFWDYLRSYYKSEYKYLKMKTKMYADTV